MVESSCRLMTLHSVQKQVILLSSEIHSLHSLCFVPLVDILVMLYTTLIGSRQTTTVLSQVVPVNVPLLIKWSEESQLSTKINFSTNYFSSN